MTFDEYSKMPNKLWWQVTDQGYWNAGAASRDAEVADLLMQANKYDLLWVQSRKERDQLRKDVTLLRDAIKYSKHQCESMRVWDGMSWVYHPLQVRRIFNTCEEALAATEPQP